MKQAPDHRRAYSTPRSLARSQVPHNIKSCSVRLATMGGTKRHFPQIIALIQGYLYIKNAQGKHEKWYLCTGSFSTSFQ